jgi:DNA replication protein DnaC
MPRIDDLLASWKRHPGNGTSHLSETNGHDATEDGCPLCGGCGFVRRDVPMGHPDFARALPCRCVQQESSESRQSRLLRYSNLGPLTRLTFENLNRRGLMEHPRDRARFERCVADAEEFAKDPNGWLVIVGASGYGKTHVAAAIANRCIAHGTPALFVVVPDLLDHLRAAYKPDAEVGYDQLFEQVRNAPVLVLDDVGTENATSWAQEKLFQIINHRFNSRLPTVITTNVPLRRTDERLRTRVTDPGLCRVYEMSERRLLEFESLNALFQPRIRSMTFERFDVSGHGLPQREAESLQAAFSACANYAGDPDGWIVLTGNPGCGKTHLAAAIANARLQLGDLPMFVKVSRLLDLYRSTFDEQTDLRLIEVAREVENAPLLMLDDLFFRPSKAWKSEWANEQLFNLIDYRYENRLPTVFTTALTEAAMGSDEVSNRFATRLWDYGTSMEVEITARAYKRPKLAHAGRRATKLDG